MNIYACVAEDDLIAVIVAPNKILACQLLRRKGYGYSDDEVVLSKIDTTKGSVYILNDCDGGSYE